MATGEVATVRERGEEGGYVATGRGKEREVVGREGGEG